MTQAAAIKVLAALIALQVGVGGVALATVEDSASSLGSSATTTTSPSAAPTLPDGTPAPSTPAATPETPPPGQQPGPAPAPSGGAPPAATADLNSLPERPSPTRPGGYTYRTKFDGQASAGTFTTQVDDEGEMTLRYESAPAENGEPRDREKTEASRSSGGFNVSGNADRQRAWRGNGMFITAESGAGSGGGGESISSSCNWEPDVQELAFPLRQGARWSWNSSCESKSENFDNKETWRGEARVTGVQTASVGGREVRVLVIEQQSERVSEYTMRRDGRESKGRNTFQETTKKLYAPSVALTVRTDTDMKGAFESSGQPGGSGRFEGKIESELLSLDPK